MSLARIVLLSFSVVLTAACDRSSEFEDCTAEIAPNAPADRCPSSEFRVPDERWRWVAGRVRRGENGVANATIRLTASRPTTTSAMSPATVITDQLGAFGPIPWVSLRYDMTLRLDAEIVAYRGLITRYVQPTLDIPFAPTSPPTFDRAFRSTARVHLDPPVSEGHTVAFFVSGDALGVTGDVEGGLTVLTERYSSNMVLHAVEYDPAIGLASATRSAKTNLLVSPSDVVLAQLQLRPLEITTTTTLTAIAPTTLPIPAHAELALVFGRTSYAPYGSVPLNAITTFRVIPDSHLEYHLRAEMPDGAVSDSGWIPWDIFIPSTTVELPATPEAIAPGPNETVLGPNLVARGGRKGIFEHVLVPKTPGSGPRIRVVAGSDIAALPTFADVGAAVPHGEYTWVVRSFPKIVFIDYLGGLDAHRYNPIGTSSPRTVIFP